jgi:hypothetical protein
LDKFPAKSILAGKEESKKILVEDELSCITKPEAIGLNSCQNGHYSKRIWLDSGDGHGWYAQGCAFVCGSTKPLLTCDNAGEKKWPLQYRGHEIVMRIDGY